MRFVITQLQQRSLFSKFQIPAIEAIGYDKEEERMRRLAYEGFGQLNQIADLIEPPKQDVIAYKTADSDRWFMSPKFAGGVIGKAAPADLVMQIEAVMRGENQFEQKEEKETQLEQLIRGRRQGKSLDFIFIDKEEYDKMLGKQRLESSIVYYDRDGNQIPEDKAKALDIEDRKVGFDRIQMLNGEDGSIINVDVWTVHSIIDLDPHHDMTKADEYPQIFETRVTGGKYDGRMWRHTDIETAESHHEALVYALLSGDDLDAL